ncbi:formimidoylglutamate deiminase [Thalassobaculum litoreum]|uniref:Formiminoglutamate deiminase n=1 Tax=Thalassobaculum litoreum DSM 18839 TaxID=1123362 RepID=A0A8G2BLI0_9PROT|nr:formimidoylglutamate deiminase [Thalassobaculum litoreum]SDG40115.1 formiminoglutamate deiminase [Thalassobaculum litoreum DSM 18839]
MTTTQIFARRARLEHGWAANATLHIENGRISQIVRDGAPAAEARRVDTMLPALGNLHSHAFQRAMAGMTERRRAGQDSFWTWRTLMYAFLERITPEQVEAIAAQVYLEMLEAGYASVGEFHYLHHQPDGTPFADLAEMSGRIAAAADRTGIGLTLLPVLYTYGGAGQQPVAGGQLRFANDPERFAGLVEAAKTATAPLPADTVVGIAPHSLRATDAEGLAATLAAHPDGPVHIHIAEQTAEIEQIEGWLGSRPVDWLLANQPVDSRWCLIHATHMTPQETAGVARSGAVAGLCPITEANLGDGIFDGPPYLAAGGAFGIGSDSNVRIALGEELRMLEYSQRLRDRARNVLVPGEGSVGETLYLGAASGGAQALGRDAGAIRSGALADLVAIDTSDPTLCALTDDQILDGLCFAAGDGVVTDVWSAGRHVVSGGRHLKRDEIRAAYARAVSDLLTG